MRRIPSTDCSRRAFLAYLAGSPYVAALGGIHEFWLALGAKAVGIGRPFLWGLGAFGQAGVQRVLEILQGELKLAMANCGTPNLAAIDRSFVATPDCRL